MCCAKYSSTIEQVYADFAVLLFESRYDVRTDSREMKNTLICVEMCISPILDKGDSERSYPVGHIPL